MAMTEALTECEQQALEHMRKAQEQGITLKEYAARMGLDVQHLYQLRKPLVRKGARARARTRSIYPSGAPAQASSGGHPYAAPERGETRAGEVQDMGR